LLLSILFFLNDPPTTGIYTLSYTTLFRSDLLRLAAQVTDQVVPRLEGGEGGHQRQPVLGGLGPERRQLGREVATDLLGLLAAHQDRKSTRLNSSHVKISYAVFCLKKKRNK